MAGKVICVGAVVAALGVAVVAVGVYPSPLIEVVTAWLSGFGH